MTNTERLEERIKQSGIKKGKIAEAVGLSRYGLDLKIKNVNQFKSEEITAICDILKIGKAECFTIFFAK